MEEIMNDLIKFQTERCWKQFHTPENLAKSISIEAAEPLEHFQWNKDYDKQEVVDELTDVLTHCLFMADFLDVDVGEIIFNSQKKQLKNIRLANQKVFPPNMIKYDSFIELNQLIG